MERIGLERVDLTKISAKKLKYSAPKREPLYVSSSSVLVTDPELNGNVSTPTGGTAVLNQTLFCVATLMVFTSLCAR
jgi:hypothetical protein